MTPTTAPPTCPKPRGTVAAGLHELARPYRARLAVTGAAVLTAAAVEVVPALIVAHVIDRDLIVGRTAGLPAAAALYLAAVAAQAALTGLYRYLAATVAQRALAGLRTRLFTHLLALPAAYHDTTPVGDSISRATTDVEAIDELFSSSAATLLGETARLITVLGAMAVLSPQLTGVVLLTVPPIALITGYLRRRIRTAERATRLALSELNTHLNEDLTAVEVIRAFGRQDAFADRFRKVLGRWLRAVNRSTFYNAYYAPALAVLSAAATAILLRAGAGHALDAAGISLGTLTAFVLLLSRFFTPLINLGDEWQTVQAALAGAERVFAVLSIPVPHLAAPPRRLAEGERGPDQPLPAVRVEGLCFGYRPDRRILHRIDLTVRPGELLAIVGRTGAGKSSLLALLAGLYTPDSGRIELAGRAPHQLTDAERRTLIGYVPQQVTLFSGTVLENITLGDKGIPDERARHAAAVTGADRFITALPRGYDTILSDTARGTGVQFSAGQRQLLALTRAITTGPAVLLLDEATASVDGASDAAFRAALRDHVLPRGTAVISIAHRLATARDADRVIVLKNGRITEHGRPADLLAANSAFAALAALADAEWKV